MNGTNVGSVFFDVKLDSKKFRKDVQSEGQKASKDIQKEGQNAGNSLGQVFGKLGKLALAAFSVKAITNFASSAIDLASDLEEVQNVVDVTFGEGNKKIEAFAQSAMTSFGLSELSAKQYMGTMGAMLKSMGLSSQAVETMSTDMVGLAGDMASFYNLDGDDAFNKIRAGISGETEPLKQLGINMSVANMEAFALSKGITKSYNSMTQAEQALLRYNYLMSVTSDAQGDFARTSDGWANQTRVLKLQWDSFKASLGGAFIQVLTPVIKVLNTLMTKLVAVGNEFKSFVNLISGKTQSSAAKGVAAIGAAAAEAGDQAEEGAKKAKGALASFDELNTLSSGDSEDSSTSGGVSFDFEDSAVDADTILPEPDTNGFMKVMDKVKASFEGLKTYVTTSFAPTIQSWGGAFQGLEEPVKNAFSSVVDSTKKLHNETLAPLDDYLKGDFVPSIANTFSTEFAPIFTDITALAFDEFAKDYQFACEQIGVITTDILQPSLETAKTITTDAMTAVGDEWENSGTKLMNLFSGFRESIRGIWTNLYDTILKPIWQAIIGAIDSLWENHLKGLWESILSFASKLGECVMTIWNNVLAPIVNWIIDVVGPSITGFVKNIISTVSTIIGIISDVCKGLLTAWGGLLDFITGVFSGNWEKAWEGIKTFFKGVWDAIWGICKGVVNLIIDGINGLWTGIYNAVKGIVNGIGGIAGAIGSIFGKDWSFSMPSEPPLIPKLAKGGIVDQPTLAMVGEAGKEAVVPLENNTGWMDGIASSMRIDELLALLREILEALHAGKVVELDKRVIGQVVTNLLESSFRTAGKTTLSV